jgi:hypothetical protein
MTQTLYNTYFFLADCYAQYACLYCESEPIKESAGGGLSLSPLHHIVEATPPVRNKKEEHDADHSIHCEK